MKDITNPADDTPVGPAPASILTDREVAGWIAALRSKDASERAPAEDRLQRLGADAIVPLANEIRQAKRRLQTRLWMLVGYSVVGILLIANVDRLFPSNDAAQVVSIVAVSAVLCAWAHIVTSPFYLQKRAADLLARVDDIRALGPLIELLRGPALLPWRHVADLLTPLLLRLRPGDAFLLQDLHRDHLHYVLKHWTHSEIGPRYGTEFYVAVLKALEQIGDPRSLPYVEQIAHHDSTQGTTRASSRKIGNVYDAAYALLLQTKKEGRTLDRQRIIAAARECLPALREQAQREQVRQSLVRASGEPDTSPDELLRPATGVASSDAQQLLRASADDAET